MKFFRILFLITILLIIKFNYSYAYEKLDFFDDFHVYTPYVYILQDDTTIEKAKILVLFHDYEKTPKKNKENSAFAKESSKWEFAAEKEKVFIVGFDLYEYKNFFEKENLDKINKRILMEADRIKTTCATKEIKIYVAGTRFGGEVAMLFNLIYDNYDGALCMNMSKPTKNIIKYLEQCKNKQFYFFYSEKCKSMDIKKINNLKDKLLEKDALAETIIYKDSKDSLPQKAYFDAVSKIK